MLMQFFSMAVLHKSGLDVTGYDVWKGSSDKYKAIGAKTEDTAEEACRDANVVVLMVVNAEQAEGVLFDKGVAKGVYLRIFSKANSLMADYHSLAR